MKKTKRNVNGWAMINNSFKENFYRKGKKSNKYFDSFFFHFL